MDVSNAVDFLFGGVVPERVAELHALWGNNAERVRLVEPHRFILQQGWGTLQVSELALRQVWLTGYAAWRATEAYSERLQDAAETAAPLDLALWRRDPAFVGGETAFAALFDAVLDIAQAETIDTYAWPADIPYPQESLEIADIGLKATFDLVCMTGGFVFAHEVRHYSFASGVDRPEVIEDEERACDDWAIGLMLDGAAEFAIAHGWPPEIVRAKRLLAIIIAMLLIVRLTPRAHWDESDGHPPVYERLRAVLDAATDPVPDWFWAAVCSMILGFADRSGVDVGVPLVPSDLRNLGYALTDQLRPA